jgi:PAS domain S-box-containing protein
VSEKSNGPFDWHSVAVQLADRALPTALVDGQQTIHLFSTAFESLVGWEREDVVGRRWTDVFRPSVADFFERRLKRVLVRSSKEFDTDIWTKEGRHLTLKIDATPLGASDAGRAVVLTVRSATPREAAPRRSEIEYEISASLIDFGKLIRSPLPVLGEESSRCYTALHQRTSPCPDCPILTVAGDWPRTQIRRIADGYEVVTAGPNPMGTISIHRHRLSDAAIVAIREAKIANLAENAGLSDRERDVLKYLLLGRSIADIASLLQITPRTVKFHQANVLEKLGADSRADLIRLVT